MASYTDKFVAFVDILGFKNMVEASEVDETQLDRIIEITRLLSRGGERAEYARYGPLTCPGAPRIAKDLDFCVTQVSDCVVISAEKSPAGLINLITRCWQVSIRLLQAGLLCRGFISGGKLYHTPEHLIGPAFQRAYAAESAVTAFKRKTDKMGTPFIELDAAIIVYLTDHPNDCINTMFKRFTAFDGSKYAIFPFQLLDHPIGLGGFGAFDPEVDRRGVETVRGWIATMKAKVLENSRNGGAAATAKAQYYLDALDRQLEVLAQTEEVIEFLQQPVPRR